MDDFFLPSQERPRGTVQRRPIGGDFDWERLRDQVLLLLRHGEPARFQCYDWKRNCLAEWYNVSKGGVIIVEGIYSTRQELRGFYDLRVWIECPRRVRLARGIERDGEQARTQWETEWMPSEDRYMTAHQPAAYADFVVKTLTPQPSRELLRND